MTQQLRGRPKGTGKNDAPYLQQVADALVLDASLKPTAAMKKVLSKRQWTESDATLIRRWQSKWKAHKDKFMSEARGRLEAAESNAQTAPMPVRGNGLFDAVHLMPPSATALMESAVERYLRHQSLFDKQTARFREFERQMVQHRAVERYMEMERRLEQYRQFERSHLRVAANAGRMIQRHLDEVRMIGLLARRGY